MVSADMDVSEQHEYTGSDTPLSTGDDFFPKVRKPYTITKQRERWTEEEHKKFLEALKLYGRAWRKIEEHVGTKTAVQIRSHAQKFFTKVVRESNTSDAGSVKPIEIPPPRPKRKPMHPYPRKLISPGKTGILIPENPTSSGSPNLDNQSPTSVLSAIGSDSSCSEMPKCVSEDVITSLIDCGDENSSPDERIPLDLELSSQNPASVKDEYPNESPAGSLKLFGKTLVVMDLKGSSSYSNSKPESSDEDVGTHLIPWRAVPLKFPATPSDYVWNTLADKSPISTDTGCQWLTLCSNPSSSSSCSTPEVHSPIPIKPQPFTDRKDNDDEKEGSSTGSNTDSLSRKAKDENEKSFSSYKLSKRISANCRKGFVPYKRCHAGMESTKEGAEDKEKQQRVRLCL